MMMSLLQKKRLSYKPKTPEILKNFSSVDVEKIFENPEKKISQEILALFPKSFDQNIVRFVQAEPIAEPQVLKIGALFSGGQASGGHNVIIGLFDALTVWNKQSQLIGFLGGPAGLINNKFTLLKKSKIKNYRNQGGFDLLGSGRTKIETPEQFEAALQTVLSHELDGLVIIGGDDSNTNAAFLAEFFASRGCKTAVIGVPKTIDGDLKNQFIQISFGFDTACKIYAEMIGNIARDTLSAKKYYHFIKLMGRSASHIALECALTTHPNHVIIGEEVLDKNLSLAQVVNEIVDLVIARAEQKKNYGVILIPEGLIEFIPEIKSLIKELNALLAKIATTPIEELLLSVHNQLSSSSKATFAFLPKEIQKQLVMDRDPHGNIQVSHIETEKLLATLVQEELKKRENFEGKFAYITHFFGYEGRAGLPTNFDANYCYSLGILSTLLVRFRLNGYLASIINLSKPTSEWQIQAVPLINMLAMEMRKGERRAVISKALVALKGKLFQRLLTEKNQWKLEDEYLLPGPIQFAPTSLSENISLTIGS